MKIDVEKDQAFLELVFRLQNNNSNAALTPKVLVDKIFNREVSRGYDYELNRWIYFFEPNQQVGMKGDSGMFTTRSRGRKTISEEKIAEIKQMRSEGHSVRSIARNVRAGEGTVKKYMR